MFWNSLPVVTEKVFCALRQIICRLWSLLGVFHKELNLSLHLRMLCACLFGERLSWGKTPSFSWQYVDVCVLQHFYNLRCPPNVFQMELTLFSFLFACCVVIPSHLSTKRLFWDKISVSSGKMSFSLYLPGLNFALPPYSDFVLRRWISFRSMLCVFCPSQFKARPITGLSVSNFPSTVVIS